MLVPGSVPFGRELLVGLAGGIRHALIGAWLVFAGLAYLAHDQPRGVWVYLLGAAFLAVIYANLRQIDELIEKPSSLEEIRRGFVINLLAHVLVAFLMGLTPWIIGTGLNAYGELMLTLMLVGYSVLFAFMHSAFPWSVFLFAFVTCLSLTAFWATTPYDFKWPLASVTLSFFLLMMRATFNFGVVLRRSIRLQIERDVARLKSENAVKELGDAMAELHLANNEKLRLFAAANHDLRQPISAISLFLGVLDRKIKRKIGEDEEMRDLLDKLDRNIQTLDVIVGTLSELTSLERGGMSIKPRSFDLRPMLQDVIHEFQGQSESARAPIRLQVPVLRMFTDPAMLARIVRNVLENALKYAPGADILVSMPAIGASRFAQQEGSMMLSIRDHGPGIPVHMRSQVFDEYIQVDNPARDRKKGYGLGLSIAKRLADALGTNIELKAAEGGGTEFLIDMSPMISTRIRELSETGSSHGRDSLQARILHSSLEATHLEVADVPKLNIVLVDDDDDVRAGLEAVFANWGHKVSGFATLKAVFEFLGALAPGEQPDLVLIDNWLPDGRGIAHVKDFKSLCPDARLVLLTGDSDPKTVERGMQLDLPVLIKPVTANKLAQLLHPPSEPVDELRYDAGL